MENNSQWFWLVIVCVPVESVRVLQERDHEVPAVQVRIRNVVRAPRHERPGAFDVKRIAAHPEEDAVNISWLRPVSRGPNRVQSSTVPVGRYITIEVAGHTLIAQAFRSEKEAEDWAKERKTQPLPMAA